MALLSRELRYEIKDILNKGVNIDDINYLENKITSRISNAEVNQLETKLKTLKQVSIPVFNIPKSILLAFEPSQIGTIVGTILDACIPQLDVILKDSNKIQEIGLLKHEGIQGEREGYPDYKTIDNYRLELKLLYVDPLDIKLKKPPTAREPSARLTQKVTYKNVDVDRDLLLVIAYQFNEIEKEMYSPTIIDVGVFPVIDCILARDIRLSLSKGRWFGDFETPTILSRTGRENIKNNIGLNTHTYGRKESEGFDFNEDTNFGKLARIPYKPLQEFLKKHDSTHLSGGQYPNKWRI